MNKVAEGVPFSTGMQSVQNLWPKCFKDKWKSEEGTCGLLPANRLWCFPVLAFREWTLSSVVIQNYYGAILSNNNRNTTVTTTTTTVKLRSEYVCKINV
jgi:hypothetical protein